MNTGFFHQLSIDVVPDISESVSNFVFEHGALGVVEEEDRLIVCFPGDLDVEELANDLLSYLHELRELFDSDFDIVLEIESIPSRDWNAEWKKTLEPIWVSDRLLIKPSWVETPENPPRHVIEIDPEMAFGSGEHATTRMTLQLLEKNVKAGMSVLDIGVGTGVLSIGALMLGAGKATAFDVDPIASYTAKRNAQKNGVADNFHVFAGTLDAVGRGFFDVIAANVNRGQIVVMLSRMSELLHVGGRGLLSGILDAEEAIIRNACDKAGLVVLSIRREQEWLAFETEKK